MLQKEAERLNKVYGQAEYEKLFDAMAQNVMVTPIQDGWEDSIEIDFQAVEFSQSIRGTAVIFTRRQRHELKLRKLIGHYTYLNVRTFFRYADQLKYARPYYKTKSSWNNFIAKLKGFRSRKQRYPNKSKRQREFASIIRRFGTYSNYLNQRAIKQGFKSYSDMRKHRFRNRTGIDYAQYRRSLLGRNGFKSNREYREYIAKKHGFSCYKNYEDSIYIKKGYANRAAYRRAMKAAYHIQAEEDKTTSQRLEADFTSIVTPPEESNLKMILEDIYIEEMTC